jgi:hypothetical protein
VNPWHMEAVTQAEHIQAQGSWGCPRKAGVRVKLRSKPVTNPGVKVKLDLRRPKTPPEVLRARDRKYRRTYRALYPDQWRLLRRAQRARYRARLKEAGLLAEAPVSNNTPQAVKRREYKRRYRERHPEKWRATRRQQKARYQARQRRALVNLLPGLGVKCWSNRTCALSELSFW